MAMNINQAENLQRDIGRQYGDIHVYGNAMLGDGHMSVTQSSHRVEEQKRMILIDDLDYTNSEAKRNQLGLTEIGPNSFAWIKKTQLAQWLQHGTTPFWISGKPGSGKSTLMRYLVDSHSTQELLDSDGRHWTILHFFYDYRAGSSIANNPIGMLRNFLLQLVRSLPSASEHIDHRQVRQQLVQGSTDNFIDILAHAIRSTRSHICAFIDGLDEFDGHLWELSSHLDILRDRTGMKMCLASRPEPDLLNAFRTFPTIFIQDHNDASIQDYIERRVLRCSSLHPNIRSIFTKGISSALRRKAHGVTLWAKLVVDEMLETYNHTTTEQSLVDLLTSFPHELEQLYDRLIAKVPDAFRSDAILVLHLVANWNLGTALSEDILFQAVIFIFEIAPHQLFFGERAEFNTVGLQVKSALGRVLDFINVRKRWAGVRLIHETLATYLRRSPRCNQDIPDRVERYRRLNAWTMLALDVVQHATHDGAFDVSMLTLKLQDLLQRVYTLYLQGDTTQSETSFQVEWERILASMATEQYIKRPDWTELASLLHTCCEYLVVLPMEDPELAPDRFDILRSVLSSDAMVLHFAKCSLCSYFISMLGPTTAKILRVWKRDRLDLVCAAIHSAWSYLSGAFNSAELESTFSADVLNILALTHYFRSHSEEILNFTEWWINQGGSVDGQLVCALTSQCDDVVSYGLVNSASFLSNYSSSKDHDRDCKYHGRTSNLMVHWLEADFYGSWVLAENMLDCFVQIGMDINAPCNGKDSAIKTLFDLSSADVRRDPDRVVKNLGAKIIALIEQDAAREEDAPRCLFKGDPKALASAVKLRRKLSVYYQTMGRIRGEDRSLILKFLDATIQAFESLEKTGTVPATKVDALRSVMDRHRELKRLYQESKRVTRDSSDLDMLCKDSARRGRSLGRHKAILNFQSGHNAGAAEPSRFLICLTTARIRDISLTSVTSLSDFFVEGLGSSPPENYYDVEMRIGTSMFVVYGAGLSRQAIGLWIKGMIVEPLPAKVWSYSLVSAIFLTITGLSDTCVIQRLEPYLALEAWTQGEQDIEGSPNSTMLDEKNAE